MYWWNFKLFKYVKVKNICVRYELSIILCYFLINLILVLVKVLFIFSDNKLEVIKSCCIIGRFLSCCITEIWYDLLNREFIVLIEN